MTSIFVSIANYRDPELPHTIDSLISQTSESTVLNIVIFSQCTEDERINFPPESHDGRIRIKQIYVDPRTSRGACWARNEIQREYAGEDYYLQLDSHVQFEPDWDRLILADYIACAIDRPAVITAYLPEYEWVDGEIQAINSFPTHFRVKQENWLPTARGVGGFPHPRPVSAYFFSGHFAFAPGRFVEDVPYDPEIFFMGEEISMAVRAFCAGYDLFTPSKFVATHNYRRKDKDNLPRALFWDSGDDAQRTLSWDDRDQASKIKVGAICRGEWRGLYGVRDLARYEQFCERLQTLFGVDLAKAIPDGTEQRF